VSLSASASARVLSTFHSHHAHAHHTTQPSRTWRLLSLLAEADVTHGLAAALCNALGITEQELDVRGCLARARVPLPPAAASLAEWRAAGGALVSRLLVEAAGGVKDSPRFEMEDDGRSAMLWCVYRRLGEGAGGQGQGDGTGDERDLLQVVVTNDAFHRAFTVVGAGGAPARSTTTSSLDPTYAATIQHRMLHLPLLLLALVRHEDREGVGRLLLEAMLTDGQTPIPIPAPPAPSGLPPLPPGFTASGAPAALETGSRRTELAKCFTAQGTINLYVVHRRALSLIPNQPYPPPQPEVVRASAALLRFEVAPASR
jgi:hypothetical protein